VTNIVAKPALPLPETSRSGAEIPPELAAIVMRCLEKRPSRRYQSMRELGEALLPFEVTQRLLKVDTSDLICIEDTGEQAEAVAAPPVVQKLQSSRAFEKLPGMA